MHFGDFTNKKQQLVHLLCAAYMTDILDIVTEEILEEYDLYTIVNALGEFQTIKTGLTKIS